MVEIFPGYGNPRELRVSGRAFEGRPPSWNRLGSSAFGLLRAAGTLMHLLRDSEEGETVFLRAGEAEAEAVTGRGGYFSCVLPAASGASWSGAVKVTARRYGGDEFRGVVYVPDPRSRTALVSDIDDTVKMTGVADKGKVVRDALTGSASTDRPVPGMAHIYTKFARIGLKGERPVCYLSATPDALSARTAGFLSINGFPPGPLLLMRLDLPDDAVRVSPGMVYDHKITAIQNLLAVWPEKGFVFLGDDGQDDPAIYSCIAAQYPRRVRGIYLRRTGPRDPAREKEYPGCVFFSTADELGRDLSRKGILLDE